jgi:uncharacterized protein (TIGR02145 family)
LYYIEICGNRQQPNHKGKGMKRNAFLRIGLLLFPLLLNCNPAGSNNGSPSDTTTTIIHDSVTDADGNMYHAVSIGSQIWTVENLKTTKYNDGTPIPLVTSTSAWNNLASPGYCWYNNNAATPYGALYNWYAVSTGKLAPAGWHVPSLAEWDTLYNYLLTHKFNWDSSTTGNKMAKAIAAQSGWAVDTTSGAIGKNQTKNNASGFSALPAGYRNYNGNFTGFGNNSYWWSASMYVATDAYSHYISYNQSSLTRYILNKGYGFSVRLVRN